MPGLGVRTPRFRDEHLRIAHHPSSILHEAQALYLHLGESSHSKASIWHEGSPTLIPAFV